MNIKKKQSSSQKMRQQSIEKYFKKQQITRTIEMEKSLNQSFVSQPMLSKHGFCSSSCLDFSQRNCKVKFQHDTIIKFQTQLSMDDCLNFVQKIVNEREKIKLQSRKKRIIKKIHKRKQLPHLTMQQRFEIAKLKQKGFKDSIIAGILCVSVNQVKKNDQIMKAQKAKIEIKLTESQKQWILNEAKKESNSILFRAEYYFQSFKLQFADSQFSLGQFRLALHQLNIRYRVPQLKPLCFFKKFGKNIELQEFIASICIYMQNNYKFVFIDECSLGNISKQTHKQWHLINTFKQNIHRMSSFRYLIAAMGQDNFLQYQIFQGTGKAYIFYEFIEQIVERAKAHYQGQQFVIVMDNCTIHKAQCLKLLLESFHHIYTPAYRPEFNAIEKLFGWLKRNVVKDQPMISSQFDVRIHQTLNLLTNNQINEWCHSILKPMQQELLLSI